LTLTENERTVIERRLRIRRRNLERLELEAKDVEESEAPPAVLGRLQAQLRVEREEIRLLETQLQEAEQRGDTGGAGKVASAPRLGPVTKLVVRVVLALIATGIILVAVQAVLRLLPHAPETATSLSVPPTHTLSPTYTAAPATSTVVAIPTDVFTSTDMITVTSGLTGTTALTATAPLAPSAPGTLTTASPSAAPASGTSVPGGSAAVTHDMTGTIATVHEDPLNLRSGPDTSYRIKRQLSNGDRLQVTGRSAASDWLAVTTVDGEIGWVKTDYLTVTVSLKSIPVKEVTGSGG
jgi:hypothetical protein